MRRLAYLSLLVAIGLSLFLLEGMIPLPVLPPGAKLGLSNLVTVIALYTLPRVGDALLVLSVRIALSSAFGGGPTVLAYSLGGGLLSFGGMALLRRTGRFSVIGVSTAGGFLHNLGQIAVASAVMESPHLFGYLPVLGPCGLATGAIIGYVAACVLPRLDRRRLPNVPSE